MIITCSKLFKLVVSVCTRLCLAIIGVADHNLNDLFLTEEDDNDTLDFSFNDVGCCCFEK